LFEIYLDEHSAKNKTVETYERDTGVVKIINRYFGNVPLSAVGPKTISEYKVVTNSKYSAITSKRQTVPCGDNCCCDGSVFAVG
jgi:hypothetical protein